MRWYDIVPQTSQLIDCIGLGCQFSKQCFYGIQKTRAKSGAALQTPQYLINSLTHHFPPQPLQSRHAQRFRHSSSNHKMDQVNQVWDILNPKGHQNCNAGSKVTAILLKQVELHKERSAPATCAAGLFIHQQYLVNLTKINRYD